VVAQRHFCNKLWNATKFALSHLSPISFSEPELNNNTERETATETEETTTERTTATEATTETATEREIFGGFVPPPAAEMTGGESALELWIHDRLAVTTERALEAWERYDFTECTAVVQRFWLEDLCAVFMEGVKARLFSLEKRVREREGEKRERGRGDSDEEIESELESLLRERRAIQNALYNAFDGGLRLLHPFMPFITEDLWQRLPRREGDPESVMVAAYPSVREEWKNERLTKEAKVAWSVVDNVRTMRGLYKIPHRVNPSLHLVTDNASEREGLEKFSDAILAMTKSSHCLFLSPSETSVSPALPRTSALATSVVTPSLKVLMDLEGIDVAAERLRLQATADKAELQLSALRRAMALPQYAKAAPAKQQKDAHKVATLQALVDEHRTAAAGLREE